MREEGEEGGERDVGVQFKVTSCTIWGTLTCLCIPCLSHGCVPRFH